VSLHPFLHDLDEPSRKVVASAAREVTFTPGAFLLREGEPAGELFLLHSGRVALELHAPGKPPAIMETLGGGDILGLSWLFPPRRWQLDARAVEPTGALAVDAARLRAEMDRDHDLGHAVARQLLVHLYDRLVRVRLQRLDLYRAEP
jgi:CRP/FNR family transcriptional regulator, cyclic AMP receptor protein